MPNKTPEASLLDTYSIGLKLRTLRNEKRMTLARLANDTGLSTALLSKLETDRMVPTLTTLSKLCKAYGVGLGYFFADAREHLLTITRKVNVSHRARRQESFESIPLHALSETGLLYARIVDFPPGFTGHADDRRRATEFVAYVLSGTLQLNFSRTQETLEAGDCAVFKTDGSLILGTREDSGCRVLIVSV